MKWKKNLLLILFLVGGIVIGSLLAAACKDVPFLSWLGFSQSIGISSQAPLVVDLSVFSLAFGLSANITVAHILCLILSVFGYKAAAKRF
ncbi:DUF4321 domain-containing protein [Zongyangia hominis]|uniref:DUF4321 domain-containing protein n=1 Tax=Zongyangia hominis TaxID=2763677 RepID=A0A926ECF1_9FIRM|nr:DUF4321 domain-containing protein [Zongyangia hominis]MBC8571342.1 DUF4321 domain-containing protein [Zongyangia hominis]